MRQPLFAELSKFTGLAEYDEYKPYDAQAHQQYQRDQPLSRGIHPGVPAKHQGRQQEKENGPGLEQDGGDGNVDELDRPREEGVFTVSENGQEDAPVDEITRNLPIQQRNSQLIHAQVQPDQGEVTSLLPLYRMWTGEI